MINNDLHPFENLLNLSKTWNQEVFSEEFSVELDNSNIWPTFRDKFHYPLSKDLPTSSIFIYTFIVSIDKSLNSFISFKVDTSLIEGSESECIYLCGNSLGLQAKTAKEYVNKEFEKWAKM